MYTYVYRRLYSACTISTGGRVRHLNLPYLGFISFGFSHRATRCSRQRVGFCLRRVVEYYIMKSRNRAVLKLVNSIYAHIHTYLPTYIPNYSSQGGEKLPPFEIQTASSIPPRILSLANKFKKFFIEITPRNRLA